MPLLSDSGGTIAANGTYTISNIDPGRHVISFANFTGNPDFGSASIQLKWVQNGFTSSVNLGAAITVASAVEILIPTDKIEIVVTAATIGTTIQARLERIQ